MAGTVQASPGFAITPSSVKATLPFKLHHKL